MPFLYGNHVLKAHLGRITEDTPEHQGVVVYSMNDTPLVRWVISLEVVRLLTMIGLWCHCPVDNWHSKDRSNINCGLSPSVSTRTDMSNADTQRGNFVSDVGEYLRDEVRNDLDNIVYSLTIARRTPYFNQDIIFLLSNSLSLFNICRPYLLVYAVLHTGDDQDHTTYHSSRILSIIISLNKNFLSNICFRDHEALVTHLNSNGWEPTHGAAEPDGQHSADRSKALSICESGATFLTASSYPRDLASRRWSPTSPWCISFITEP